MTNKPLQKYLKSEAAEMAQIAEDFTNLLGVETFVELRKPDGFFYDTRYDIRFAEAVYGITYLEINISYEGVRAAWNAAQFFHGVGRVAQIGADGKSDKVNFDQSRSCQPIELGEKLPL